jgi:enediyne biosynthesis protein E3
MRASLGWMRRALLGLHPREASFDYRGFRGGDATTRKRIEQIVTTFLEGYHYALSADNHDELHLNLEGMPKEVRGFAYEAAAMGLSVLDILTFWRRDRFARYLDGSEKKGSWSGIAGEHRYMAYIGFGLAYARMKQPIEPALSQLDPFYCWLAMDGYGFHQGFFEIKRYVDRQEVPEGFSGYTQRGFDQGLGRSLWFVEGADVRRIPATIAAFEPTRQADLWSGAGLALAYAGGVTPEAVRALFESAGSYQPDLAQGVAFAAMTRAEAGNPAPQTELASLSVWDLPAAGVATLAQESLRSVKPDAAGYETTRRLIRQRFSNQEVAR